MGIRIGWYVKASNLHLGGCASSGAGHVHVFTVLVFGVVWLREAESDRKTWWKDEADLLLYRMV